MAARQAPCPLVTPEQTQPGESLAAVLADVPLFLQSGRQGSIV